MKICPKCQTEHSKEGTFCSRKCANSHNFGKKYNTKLVKTYCLDCEKEIKVIKNQYFDTARCLGCKKLLSYSQRNNCYFCGQVNCRNKYCHYSFQYSLVKFGLDTTKIGSLEYFNEIERIKNLLTEEYYEAKLSVSDLGKKYGHSNLHKFLTKNLGLCLRSFSIANSIASSRYPRPVAKSGTSRYKQGWHETWNHRKVFYRSSYELDLALQLDKAKIDYLMEFKGIEYFDSKDNRLRIAYPDFYLPEENKIIEVKSSYTYEKQNMLDRFKAYQTLGYKVELQLNHEIVLI